MTDIRDVFASNLKKFRQARGWSQALLAEKADASPNYIGMLENKIKFPSPGMIQKVALALGIDPTELFYKEIDPAVTMNCCRKAALEDVCGFIEGEIRKLNEETQNRRQSFHAAELDKTSGERPH
jgi:transcriptional regulator with XRE-family HTH domain